MYSSIHLLERILLSMDSGTEFSLPASPICCVELLGLPEEQRLTASSCQHGGRVK